MVDNNLLSKLYANFELRSREGTGGKRFKYIPSDAVIDRMNKVFQGCWGTEVLEEKLVEDQILVKVRVTAHHPDINQQFQHDGYGSAAVMRFKSGKNQDKIVDLGNIYKSAEAMAIRHACTRFGVGLYLEGDGGEFYGGDVDDTSKHVTVKEHKPVNNSNSMPGPAPITANIHNTTINDSPINSNVSTNTNSQPVKSGIKTPAGAKTNNHGPKIPSPNVSVPIPNSTSSNTANAGISFPGGVQSVNTNINTTTEARITDVQKAAIEGILSIRGVEYEDLITQSFTKFGINVDSVPKISELTYSQAVAAVKHGNALFRKQ